MFTASVAVGGDDSPSSPSGYVHHLPHSCLECHHSPDAHSLNRHAADSPSETEHVPDGPSSPLPLTPPVLPTLSPPRLTSPIGNAAAFN